MEKLKPCPFCGKLPEFEYNGGTFYEFECSCGLARVSIQICDLMTIEEREEGYDDKTHSYLPEFVKRAEIEAIKKWNTRKGEK